jgi:hypothetical protein
VRPTQTHSAAAASASKRPCPRRHEHGRRILQDAGTAGVRGLVATLSIERHRVTGQDALAEAILDYFIKHGQTPPADLVAAIRKAPTQPRPGTPVARSPMAALCALEFNVAKRNQTGWRREIKRAEMPYSRQISAAEILVDVRRCRRIEEYPDKGSNSLALAGIGPGRAGQRRKEFVELIDLAGCHGSFVSPRSFLITSRAWPAAPLCPGRRV